MSYKNREDRISYMREWRKTHKEQISEYKKNNSEKIKESSRIYRIKNELNRKKYLQSIKEDPNKRESFLKYRRDYYQKNKHKRKNRSLKPSSWVVQRIYELNILKYGTLTCELCFNPTKFGDDSIDHLQPISRGGTNDFWNLAVAHKTCNFKKNSKNLDEWFALKPHLT